VACLAIIWSLPTTAIKIAGTGPVPPELEIDAAALAAAATAASTRVMHDGSAPTRKRLALHNPEAD
jgi:hypothetical protein